MGSCVNFCRVKTVEVQRGCPEVSISWDRGPLRVALKCKAFCCGMHLVGLVHLKQIQCHGFKNHVFFQVQGRDVLVVSHQVLSRCSLLAWWSSSRFDTKLAAKMRTGNVLTVRDGKSVMIPAVDEVLVLCASMVSGLSASSWEG